MVGTDGPSGDRLQAAREGEVSIDGTRRPFAELTRAEVGARAEEIGSVGGWGPLARAAKVARAWAGLGSTMDERGAGTVGELDPADIVRFAEYTWVIPPEGGLI